MNNFIFWLFIDIFFVLPMVLCAICIIIILIKEAMHLIKSADNYYKDKKNEY